MQQGLGMILTSHLLQLETSLDRRIPIACSFKWTYIQLFYHIPPKIYIVWHNTFIKHFTSFIYQLNQNILEYGNEIVQCKSTKGNLKSLWMTRRNFTAEPIWMIAMPSCTVRMNGSFFFINFCLGWELKYESSVHTVSSYSPHLHRVHRLLQRRCQTHRVREVAIHCCTKSFTWLWS